jgi:hypothetical protein
MIAPAAAPGAEHVDAAVAKLGLSGDGQLQQLVARQQASAFGELPQGVGSAALALDQDRRLQIEICSKLSTLKSGNRQERLLRRSLILRWFSFDNEL